MNIKYILASTALIFMHNIVCAQKLPNKQEVSVFAPGGIKTDGKATEWNNTFQAYNRATEISYTLANDADNLYLVCQATEVEVIQKMLNGGITLTVSATDKNSTLTPAKATYPIIPWTSVQINHLMKAPAPLEDDVVTAINKRINGQLKLIKVSGIKEFAEGTVPVYNDAGIVMAQNVTKDKVYTLELAFPLKYIRQLINNKGTFNYGITVNGDDPKTTIVVGGGNLFGAATEQAVARGMEYAMTPTYFTATYTLAAKP
jgi:hypothetical protein